MTVWNEMQQAPDSPIIIVGDLSCNMEDLCQFNALVSDGTFVDLGARASIWGRPTHEPTCQAHNADSPTRRDYILANRSALLMVKDFNVLKDPTGTLPVHSMLRVVLHTSTLEHETKKINLKPP